MSVPTIAISLMMSLSAAFWLGHYNQVNKDKDGWAWLWMLCLLITELRICGVIQ